MFQPDGTAHTIWNNKQLFSAALASTESRRNARNIDTLDYEEGHYPRHFRPVALRKNPMKPTEQQGLAWQNLNTSQPPPKSTALEDLFGNSFAAVDPVNHQRGG
ncbi:hypothetical protein SKAU_G00274880 [Synaphobranchus kaupii]|uniref:Uncharacterized protein n=1 Tax=Synaphobranchus kaupii TaxID=118154 RepID=A0A9Q1IQY7_SYNKA|nr:hypothetical protein SKAU_G00274880 [Synaphobranchus kaupii]